MKNAIKNIYALEILDSRGCPTVKVHVVLEGDACGSACAPSGASTGRREKHERRDGDKSRYFGRGVQSAVSLIRSQVHDRFVGWDAFNQMLIDHELQHFYGKKAGAALGSNVTAAVSMAVACAAAAAAGLPLYRYLGGPWARRLPMPMMNVLNGGKHADSELDFQEFMIVPLGAPTFAEAMRYGAETFHSLKALLTERGFSTAVGDEGGFAPALSGNEEACALIQEAIERAGYEPGRDISIALDPAASSFWRNGQYYLGRHPAKALSAAMLEEEYSRLVTRYPIVSIEDGFAEDDWEAFVAQTREIGRNVQIVGDDLYVTDADAIRRGADRSATNAVLIKINQIGTVTQAVDAIGVCRQRGLAFVISHRSGETEDTFIADFSVAMGGGQIKTGSLSRSERLAKYNRLLEIEQELGDVAQFCFLSPQRSVESPPIEKGRGRKLEGAAAARARARAP